MPDESRQAGEEGPQVCSVPDITVVSVEGRDEGTGGELLELEDLSQTTNDGTRMGSDDKSQSPVSVELGVVRTTTAPQPLQVNSLMKGAPMEEGDLVKTSGLRPETGCSDSDYSSIKSSPGYTCTSFSDDVFHDLDKSSFEKSSPVSPLNFTQADDRDAPEATVQEAGSPTFSQPRVSMDSSWDDHEDGDEDGQSTRSRRTVKEGMCCCYQAFHRACLQCVEETPAMVSGLVLSLAFCVAIIVLIPTTGRVSAWPVNTCKLHILVLVLSLFSWSNI